MTKLIFLDSLLKEGRVLAPQGPSSISAVAELVLSDDSSVVARSFLDFFKGPNNTGNVVKPSPAMFINRGYNFIRLQTRVTHHYHYLRSPG